MLSNINWGAATHNKKAPLQGLLGGLWQIRTVDLFRVKEAL